MDTIRYFDTKGIKLDRKMLYIYLKKGGIYKGFTFQYVQYPNDDFSSRVPLWGHPQSVDVPRS